MIRKFLKSSDLVFGMQCDFEECEGHIVNVIKDVNQLCNLKGLVVSLILMNCMVWYVRKNIVLIVII